MNPEILKILPQAIASKGQYCTLARLDGLAAWKFLVQPTDIPSDRSYNYSESNTVGSIPNMQPNRLDAWQVSISVPLSGLQQKKSLQSYIDAIASLLEPDKAKDSPPVLALVWGQRQIIAPCVMTKFSKKETLWYPNGEIAECAIGFSLTEVPISQVILT